MAFVAARTPFLVDNDPIDYGTAEGKKLFESACAPLKPLFDGKPESIVLFLNNMKVQASRNNWNHILNTPDSASMAWSLLKEYGLLTMENVRAAALAYTNVAPVSRDAQNSEQI